MGHLYFCPVVLKMLSVSLLVLWIYTISCVEWHKKYTGASKMFYWSLQENAYMQNRQSSNNMPVKYVLLTHHAICRVQFEFTTGKHHSSWIHLGCCSFVIFYCFSGSCLSVIFCCFPFHLCTFSFVKNEPVNLTLQHVGKGWYVRLNQIDLFDGKVAQWKWRTGSQQRYVDLDSSLNFS